MTVVPSATAQGDAARSCQASVVRCTGRIRQNTVPTKDGYRVTIRRSKTDQTGEGQEIAVPRGLKLRPVECMEHWLEAAAITEGRVFRAVLRGGRVQGSLTPECLSKAVKKLAARIAMDAKTVGAHSLRAGFVSTCVETNAPLLKIAEGRPRSPRPVCSRPACRRAPCGTHRGCHQAQEPVDAPQPVC